MERRGWPNCRGWSNAWRLPAAEHLLDRILFFLFAQGWRGQPGRLLLDVRLPGAQGDDLFSDLDTEVADPGAAGRESAKPPRESIRARQPAAANLDVVVLVRTADDLEVVELESGTEAHRVEASPLDLDGQRGRLVDPDPLRLQGRLDPQWAGGGGRGDKDEKDHKDNKRL